MGTRFVGLSSSQETHADTVVGNRRSGPDCERPFQGIDRLLVRTVPRTSRTQLEMKLRIKRSPIDRIPGRRSRATG